MNHNIQNVNRLILEEFWDSQVGRILGKGMTRTVYDFPITNDKWVIKVEDNTETGDRHFQNVREWQVWKNFEGTDMEHWFAPCHWISESGKVLIMRKTQIMGKAEYPDKVPAFFNDIKFENFGKIDGNVVCHDYGILNPDKILDARRGAMVTAHWWSVHD